LSRSLLEVTTIFNVGVGRKCTVRERYEKALKHPEQTVPFAMFSEAEKAGYAPR
jgi:hypothetical protein